MTILYDSLALELAAHGLLLRGGFHPTPADAIPVSAPGVPAATVLMIGNAGAAMWVAFETRRPPGANPLDRWTREIITPIAARLGARAIYPYDKPAQPFQRWAARAWPLFPSPLGLLIDPDYGLWHALRGALLFADALDLPTRIERVSPCISCSGKPCLTSCPVGAYDGIGFDYTGCRDYLETPAAHACNSRGCGARNACPVGTSERYPPAQQQFHSRAFRGVSAND